MKKLLSNRRTVAIIISILLIISMISGTVITVFADETKILTLGADLTDEQKQLIINYLGVDINNVEVITVNNEDEHQYLDGIVSEQTIGHHTYSCSTWILYQYFFHLLQYYILYNILSPSMV